MKVNVLWCDGEGAASRGFSDDGYVLTTIEANTLNEVLQLAYYLKLANMCKSVTSKDLDSLLHELQDEYGYEDEDLFYDDYEDALNKHNYDGFDGGDVWIIGIYDDNEVIYGDLQMK